MPLDATGKETGWLSRWAFQVAALAANVVGRQAMEDGYVNEAKLAALAVSEGKLAAPSADGLHPTRIARATYDLAVLGGVQGVIALGVTLPDNAIVTRAWYEVLTTLQSATDAATVSVDIPTDDVAGIVAAIAIDDISDPWDAGLHEAIQDGTATNYSTKTTAARELSITIAGGEDLTAGKFIVFCEYVVSD